MDKTRCDEVPEMYQTYREICQMIRDTGDRMREIEKWLLDMPRSIENPALEFNRELQESLDPETKAFKPGTRLAEMSSEEYEIERVYVTELSELWGDRRMLSRDQLADAIMLRYGGLPKYIAKFRDLIGAINRPIAAEILPEMFTKRIYAGGLISRCDLACYDSDFEIMSVNHVLDEVLIEIFKEYADEFSCDRNFLAIGIVSEYVNDGKPMYSGLMDSTGSTQYITENFDGSYVVHDEFYHFLLAQPSWENIAGGVMEREICRRLAE